MAFSGFQPLLHSASIGLFAFALTASAPCGAETNGVCTSCPEVLSALRSPHPDETAFALTGTVAATWIDNNMILWDGTDAILLRCRDRPIPVQPAVGDRIRATGYVGRETHGGRIPYVRTITVLGQGEILPPTDFDAFRPDMDSDACHRLRLRGTVVDRYADDVDPRFQVILIKAGSRIVNLTLPTSSSDPYTNLVANSTIEAICWRFPVISGRRIFRDALYFIESPGDLAILHAAPDNPFAVPDIEHLHHIPPTALAQTGRHGAVGTVIATWKDHLVLVKTDSGRIVKARLTNRCACPRRGSRIRIAGYPRTDLYHVNLAYASWEPAPGEASPVRPPKDVTPKDVLRGGIRQSVQVGLHGETVRLKGTVTELTDAFRAGDSLVLSCNGTPANVDISACPELLGTVIPGSTVSVVGICIIETDDWSADNPLPRIRGFSVLLQSADDLTVLSTPPWWTPFRFVVVICALLACLFGILVWTRILSKIVARRSRQLLKAEIGKAESDLRVGERTRLALELHDSIAQILTGVGFQIEAAESTLDDDRRSCANFLSVAKKTLLSCREELRRCLWDLKGPALEEPDFDTAIRMTLEPVADSERVSVRTGIARGALSDLTAHALLCSIRELTVNAFRHGKADKVSITGSQEDKRLTICVEDNGVGFDPNRHPGPSEGHFGLQGVAERIARIRGRLSIVSQPGTGTRITLEIRA